MSLTGFNSKNNTIAYTVDKELYKVPFVDILLPYTETFIHKFKEVGASTRLVRKLHKSLLCELSSVSEVVLQEELDVFKNGKKGDYLQFITESKVVLSCRYPVLDNLLRKIADSYLNFTRNIFSNFNKDLHTLAQVFSINISESVIIDDLNMSLGDGHAGESTALVILTDGTKLVYKPRNIDTTTSYNLFVSWVSHRLNIKLKTIKSVSCGEYGWLEFVAYKPIENHDELQDYYYRAGTLLAITLLLGSKDCHYENVIAAGSMPVIIDHETIVQPVLSKQSIHTWDKHHKIPTFSVLESMLIGNQATGVSLEYTGFGVKGNTEAMDLGVDVINPNTIECKRETRITFRSLVKENIPLYNDTYVFVNEYKNHFVKGFSDAYDMFLGSRDDLMSHNSPLQLFINKRIRYVWRPTFVYFRILKYMRKAAFMCSFEVYNAQLYSLMSKAYKNENLEKYRLILESEIKQLVNGDIPLFNLDSSGCCLEADKSFEIFQHDSIKNIKTRISTLSEEHKVNQLEYINTWFVN